MQERYDNWIPASNSVSGHQLECRPDAFYINTGFDPDYPLAKFLTKTDFIVIC